MLSSIILAIFLNSGRLPSQTSALRLQVKNNDFIVSNENGKKVAQTPIDPQTSHPEVLAFRQNDKFVVFDKRGLTIRVGNNVFNTQFKEIPVSPRLQTHQEILSTLEKVKDGSRSLIASGLSGGFRLGANVYFLVHWQSGTDPIWLEALVSVNLNSNVPRPTAISSLRGTTFSMNFIGNNLYFNKTELYAYTHGNGEWGRWSYTPLSKEIAYQTIGGNPVQVFQFKDKTVGFIEKSDYQTYYSGIFDESDMTRKCLQETNNKPQFLSEDFGPIIKYFDTEANLTEFVNLRTGAKLALPGTIYGTNCKVGTILWEGNKSPTRAWLYQAADWHPRAWMSSK